MRSFTPKTIALAACLSIAPFAGAYAAAGHGGAMDEEVTPNFHGPRLEAVLDQIQGVDRGIADARQGKQISPAEASMLLTRAAHISQAAEKVAATDHGRIPAAQYHQILRRLDRVDQKLQLDTGNGFMIGDGADG